MAGKSDDMDSLFRRQDFSQETDFLLRLQNRLRGIASTMPWAFGEHELSDDFMEQVIAARSREKPVEQRNKLLDKEEKIRKKH